ncbi:glycosyltransferase family 2 protein [Acetonema longum]|uniref:Putative glycosyltransferase n=1 Tax=Acetonema longum DSM 6540 TaxID=1009370 RepID=F7NLY6_9FIRM|nr:glycosyltransferase family 2 protein [Acetonema longum]EGO62912.1 putative glycosyltransferase [Acetonema longum DSM 6540]
MKDLVSVIVPAYNVSLYIGECIYSVKQQTYKNWELIVIDDGSTDHTFEIAQRCAKGDEKIRVHRQENQGVSVARNKGMELAQGQWVVFLDGDDYWTPELLAKLVAEKQTSGADVAYCGYNHAYSNGFVRRYRYKYPNGDLLLPFFRGKVRLQIGAMLITKALLIERNIAFTPGCLTGQDWEVIAKLTAVANFSVVPENLHMYRVRPNSAITSKWNWKKRIHTLFAYRRAAEFVLQERREAPDLPKIRTVLDKSVAFKFYKFLWRTIKAKAYDDALALMDNAEYKQLLDHIDENNLALIDRLKFYTVLSRNKWCWRCARLF